LRYPRLSVFSITAAMTADCFGFLNINKPTGRSSRWVVDRVQELVRPAKAGHAGTLDPLATGVLVVCVGQATRLVDYVQQKPKTYRAEFLLGRTSSTEDVEGLMTELINPPQPTRAELVSAAAKFVGTIQQRPPAFSALKVGGKRAYALARKGQPVELKPRPITVFSLEVVDYAYPQLTLDIQCSGGTYVRSLGRDLAESLGTAAVMSKLERTAIGEFEVSQAIEINSLNRDNLASHLIAPLKAVNHLSKVQLDENELKAISHGLFIERPIADNELPQAEFAALDVCGNLAAILHRRRDGRLGPLLNFQAK
jgi:tRNA pseudouridine55 synthase